MAIHAYQSFSSSVLTMAESRGLFLSLWMEGGRSILSGQGDLLVKCFSSTAVSQEVNKMQVLMLSLSHALFLSMLGSLWI